MTNEQLIEKFNPLNGSNLSAEDLETLHNLTDEQIDVLANAYPNQPSRKAYLRLYDKNIKPEKQVYNLSTWQNLRNLRKFNAKKNLIAWDFFTVAGAARQPVKATAPVPGAKTPKKVVVDMTAKEAAAELTKNVDNPNGKKEDTTPAKVTKPATSAKKGGKASTSAGAEVNVENQGTGDNKAAADASQEFTDGQGK